MAVSKRLRTEILRRDNSTCQNCGATAPGVALVVDHVVPIALGGSDEPSNLQALCEPCNSGKSATPPDAATVAQVALDARRWAAAMQAAADSMLRDLESRQQAREYFKECWLNWHWGTAEKPEYAPLPATWEKSVDQITAAGLPVVLLKDCIDTAFAYEKVARENKFKYACGVAWRKIEKLQDAAHAAVGEEGPSLPDDGPRERQSLVEDLISVYTEGDLEEAQDNGIEVDAVRRGIGRENEEQRDPVVALVECIHWDYRMEADFTHSEVMDLLLAMPDGVGEHALKVARFALYDDGEEPHAGRGRFLRKAMRCAIELLEVRASMPYLDSMPAQERAAWLTYGCALEAIGRHPGRRGDKSRELAKAAEAARVIKGGQYYPAMCQVPGDLIPTCSNPARFYVLFDDVKCCESAHPDGRHAVHGFCDQHLESVVDQGFPAPNGPALTVRDFWEWEAPAEQEPPF